MVQSSKVPAILFYSFLSLIFIFEGFGWRGGREVSFALALAMPVFLFLLDIILGKKVIIPKIPTILYGAFILFSTVSTFFSVDVGRSFPYLLFYIALYAVFVYVYNHQEELKKYVLPFIFIFSFVFSIYALFVNFLIQLNFDFFYPEWGYQFVYSRFGSHNQLGNLLIIPMIISFYKIFLGEKKSFYYFTLIYFLPFFILSFSRSAYLSLTAMLVFMIIYLANRRILKTDFIKILLIVLVIGISSTLFFATTVDFKNKPITSTVHSFLVGNFRLQDKTFISKRTNFVTNAFDSIIEKPLFGVGPLNYRYISQKYTDFPTFYTDTSHNLILEIFSENGVLAGFSFIIFLSLIIIKGRESKFYFWMAFVMLLNFQTIYTFKIYSYFLLFFVLLGLLIQLSRSEN